MVLTLFFNRFDQLLERLKEYAPIFIRLAFGYHLVQYTYEDILFLKAHIGFGAWLAQMGVPFPSFMAYVALGTEFVGGLCLIFGLLVRYVSIFLIANFITAICLVHLDDPYKKSFEAIQMLMVSLFFLFNGAGKLSIDSFYGKKIRS
ncbi:MAG: DoxX family protein [Blastocatellia bacterium]|nr:DoxX family protein [Blastocatellia bacterium]